MQHLRRIILFLAFLVFCLCVILLLNFTAPNLTGRRYSSRVITNDAMIQEKGDEGEAILAADLHLPNNNDPGQRQCLCRDSSIADSIKNCHFCLAVPELLSSYRRPDFVSDRFLADSKNVRLLRDFDQIRDYATAAKSLKRSLWIYVRVNTMVDDRYCPLVESTGGGIVFYFATPGYIDPVDHAARIGLLASSGVWVFFGLLDYRARRRRRNVVYISVSPTPQTPATPRDPISKTIKAVENAERFKHNIQNHRRNDMEELE